MVVHKTEFFGGGVADMNLNLDSEYNCEKKKNDNCNFDLWRWLMA